MYKTKPNKRISTIFQLGTSGYSKMNVTEMGSIFWILGIALLACCFVFCTAVSLLDKNEMKPPRVFKAKAEHSL
jgi:predicted outer membrane lipoprotein